MVGTIVVEAAASTPPTDNAADPPSMREMWCPSTADAYDNIGNELQPWLGPVWNGECRLSILEQATWSWQYANFNYQGTEVSAIGSCQA